MTQVSEIKCPHCGEWTMWKGQVDDRCLYCGEFLEPDRFSREVEKKIVGEVKKENDYFALKPGDGPLKRRAKIFLNSFRWAAFYLQIAFFIFITLLIVLISLFAV
jgi:DNA-directed RNA polymerase subunit RPC12/RpoP